MDSYHSFSASSACVINKKLLEWFNKEKRTLPWRSIELDGDIQEKAYKVLVSEVMLQQTKVSTVIPYYSKWITRWPSLKDLSSSKLEDVLNVWKGLGYYPRARRLWELSQSTNVLPTRQDLLLKLPGIGPYTSGAVASIVYGEQVPAVDGNVTRVLCRLRAIGGSVYKADVKMFIHKLAYSIVPDENPGDWNQALMDLGATVCSPKNPKCAVCPLNEHCHSFKNISHDVEDCHLCLPGCNAETLTPILFPAMKEKTKPRQETQVVCLVHRNNKFFLVKNANTGILADLWQFPSCTVNSGLNDWGLKRAAQRFLKTKFGIKSKLGNLGAVVDHKYSHISMKYQTVIIETENSEGLPHNSMYSDSCWVSTYEFKRRPVSVGMQKIFATLTISHKAMKTKRK